MLIRLDKEFLRLLVVFVGSAGLVIAGLAVAARGYAMAADKASLGDQGGHTLVSWDFRAAGSPLGWSPNGEILNLRVGKEGLHMEPVGSDPILMGPFFKIPAFYDQWIEIRMKSDVSGLGQVFWTDTTEPPYGGFRPNQATSFAVLGDEEWHVYRLYPFWSGLEKVIHIRLDPPAGGKVELASIRIMAPDKTLVFSQLEGRLSWETHEDWSCGGILKDAIAEGWVDSGYNIVTRGSQSAVLVPSGLCPIRGYGGKQRWVSICLKVDRGSSAYLVWVAKGYNGLQKRPFPLRADGAYHVYNLDMWGFDMWWKGEIEAIGIQPTEVSGARASVRWLKVGCAPLGEPQLFVEKFDISDGLCRAGRPFTADVTVKNTGGEAALDVQALLELPQGLSLVREAGAMISRLEPFEEAEFSWQVVAGRSLQGMAGVIVKGINVPTSEQGESRVLISVADALPEAISAEFKASGYIPQPKPVRTPYMIGAYYFPGWFDSLKWDPIRKAGFPQPLLGFYDDASPEVADWHIKWACEHGISFFIYDWYWRQGRSEEDLNAALHKGYFGARYRSYMKFCLLWANHPDFLVYNVDQLVDVGRYWLDNYFKRPEYLTIEGRPVVFVFAPGQLFNDVGFEGVKEGFRIIRELAKEQGLPGVCFVGCTGPDGGLLEKMRAAGYDAASGYNYAGAGATDGMRALYESMVDGYRDIWDGFASLNMMKYIIPLSPGWDPRPWHGENTLVRTNPSPEQFERMLRLAKERMDTKQNSIDPKIAIIEAWNEWGEGSYIEPTRKWGFRYLDAIRSVFAPDAGDHHDIVPIDLGLTVPGWQ